MHPPAGCHLVSALQSVGRVWVARPIKGGREIIFVFMYLCIWPLCQIHVIRIYVFRIYLLCISYLCIFVFIYVFGPCGLGI